MGGGGKNTTALPSHSFRPAPRKSRYFQVDWKFNFAIFFYFSRKSSVTWHVLVPSYLTNYMFSWPTLKAVQIPLVCVCTVHGFRWYSSARVHGGIWKTFCPQSRFLPRHSGEDIVCQEHTLLWDGLTGLSKSRGKVPISLAALVRFCKIVDLL